MAQLRGQIGSETDQAGLQMSILVGLDVGHRRKLGEYALTTGASRACEEPSTLPMSRAALCYVTHVARVAAAWRCLHWPHQRAHPRERCVVPSLTAKGQSDGTGMPISSDDSVLATQQLNITPPTRPMAVLSRGSGQMT